MVVNRQYRLVVYHYYLLQGTSTQASRGRLVMRPVFITLPPILMGTPVSIASIIREAYSYERYVLTPCYLPALR